MSRVHILSLDGERFGRWLVMSRSHKNARGEIFWRCRCDCGSERNIRANILTSEASTSCGCYHREAVTTHGMSHSRTWRSWQSMLARCETLTSPDYHRYGGRGISVCLEWHDFESFLSDMGERPASMSLERKDVDGNYGPNNCVWATATVQQRNRRDAIRLTLRGVTKNVHDWAEELGIAVSTLKSRSGARWTDELTLTTPARPKAAMKGA